MSDKLKRFTGRHLHFSPRPPSNRDIIWGSQPPVDDHTGSVAKTEDTYSKMSAKNAKWSNYQFAILKAYPIKLQHANKSALSCAIAEMLIFISFFRVQT